MKLVIPLSSPQIKKLLQFEKVTVSMSGPKKQDCIVHINDVPSVRKLLNAFSKGKGSRLDGKAVTHIEVLPSSVEGGKINVGKAFKKFGNDMKKGFTKAGDSMKETAFEVNHALKSNRAAKAITKSFVPELSGELAGHLAKGAITYLTGAPEIGDAFGKATNKGVKSGVTMALKSEGYGLRQMRRNKLDPIAIEPVENVLPPNINKNKRLASDPNFNQKLKKANQFETLAVDPRPSQINTMIELPKSKARVTNKRKSTRGKGFRGYGDGFRGYGDGFRGY